MANDTERSERASERQSYIIPIQGRPHDLGQILNNLRRAGLDIRHVFTETNEWKVVGDLPVSRLDQLRLVDGIGEPRLEGRMTLEGPRDVAQPPPPTRAPGPIPPPSRAPRTGSDLA